MPSKKKSSLSQQQQHKKSGPCPPMKKLAPKKANAAPKQKQHQPSTGSTDELETKIGTLEAQEQVLRTKMQRISKQAATLQRKRDALKIRAYDALKRPNGKQGASSASAGSSIRSPADARRGSLPSGTTPGAPSSSAAKRKRNAGDDAPQGPSPAKNYRVQNEVTSVVGRSTPQGLLPAKNHRVQNEATAVVPRHNAPEFIDSRRDGFKLTDLGIECETYNSIILHPHDDARVPGWVMHLLSFLRRSWDQGFQCMAYEDTMRSVFGTGNISQQTFVLTINAAIARGLIEVKHLDGARPLALPVVGRPPPSQAIVAPPIRPEPRAPTVPEVTRASAIPKNLLPRAGLAAGSQPAREDSAPEPIVPKNLLPLLEYMRGGNPHVSRRHIRNIFKRAPDSPYGKTSASINPVVEHAIDLGLLVGGGQADSGWVALPDHDVLRTLDCELCQSANAV